MGTKRKWFSAYLIFMFIFKFAIFTLFNEIPWVIKDKGRNYGGGSEGGGDKVTAPLDRHCFFF